MSAAEEYARQARLAAEESKASAERSAAHAQASAEATTDGQVHNQPSGNRGSVAAEKNNDFDTQVGKPEQAKEQ